MLLIDCHLKAGYHQIIARRSARPDTRAARHRGAAARLKGKAPAAACASAQRLARHRQARPSKSKSSSRAAIMPSSQNNLARPASPAAWPSRYARKARAPLVRSAVGGNLRRGIYMLERRAYPRAKPSAPRQAPPALAPVMKITKQKCRATVEIFLLLMTK